MKVTGIRHLFPAVLLLCTLATAQTQESDTTQNPADTKIFRIDVNLVQVDAVVTDKEGRPVIDLTAEDFIILQDGKPQEITNFSLVRMKEPIVPAPIVKEPAAETKVTAPPLPLPVLSQ